MMTSERTLHAMISETQTGPCYYGHPGSCLMTWSPPAAILELALEETGLVDELIESYTTDMQLRLQRIRVALRNLNWQVLRTEVHTIKGSSRQMAADQVAFVCEQIETTGPEWRNGRLTQLVHQLEAGISEVCEAMAWYQRS